MFGHTKMPGRTNLMGSVWVPRYVLGPTPARRTMRVFEMCDCAHAGSLCVGGRSIVHVSPILFIYVNRIILLDNLLCCGTEGHNSLDVVLIFLNLKSAFSVRKTAGNSRSASYIPNLILMSWGSTREGIRQCLCRRNEHLLPAMHALTRLPLPGCMPGETPSSAHMLIPSLCTGGFVPSVCSAQSARALCNPHL